MRKERHKRGIGYLIVAFLILALSLPVSAKGNRQTIRVAFYDLDGYQETDEAGVRSGYAYDVLHLISRYENLDYTYVALGKTWTEAFEMFKNGEIDLLLKVSRNPIMDEYVDYTDEPIALSPNILTTKVGNNRFTVGDYGTYNGIRVGIQVGSFLNNRLSKFAEENHFSYRPLYVNTQEKMQEDLQSGEVDAILTNGLRILDNEWILATLDQENVYAAVQKGNTELLNKINHAFLCMDQNEGDWRKELYNKHYNRADSMVLHFTQEERALIAKYKSEGKILTVACNPDLDPYCYLDEHGKIVGILPDIFDQIMGRLGLQYELVEIKDRDAYSKTIRSAKVDLILDLLSSNYRAEKMGYLCSCDYFKTSRARVFRNDSTIKTASRVGAIELPGDSLQDARARSPHTDIQLYKTLDDLLDAIAESKTDLAYVFSYCAEKRVNENPESDLTFSLLPNDEACFCIGVNQVLDYGLSSAISKSIRSINLDAGATQTIIANHMIYQQPRLTFKRFVQEYPHLALIVIITVCILSVLAALTLDSRKYQKKLEDALHQAESANRAKSTFLSNMSHDIRTPMNAIIGFSAIAEKHLDNREKIQDCIAKIKMSSNHLLSLINDVLDMSSIESGKIELSLKPSNLLEALKDVEVIMSEDVQKKELNVSYDYSSITDTNVYIDSLRFHQVILNLISNAVKYTRLGGRIEVTAKEEPCGKEGYAKYIFMVKDTGIGMKPEFVEKIFEPFARERNTTMSGVVGTGLGMAITKKIIDLSGGDIVITSEENKGTEVIVTVTLQLTEANEQTDEFLEPMDSADIPIATPENDRNCFEGKRILLVEDNDLNREIAKELLEEEGFVVEVATNGREALSLVSSMRPDYYDVILMDLQMPVMDGYEATKRIRNLPNPKRARIAIVAMTANAFDEDKKKAMECGMDNHVAKPVDMDNLRMVLRSILS